MESNGFSAWDWVVFSLSLVASLGVGIYASWSSRLKLAKKNNDDAAADEFLMGGRQMNFISIAISTFIGAMSSILILGSTAEMYAYGTQLWMNIIGMVLCFFYVHLVILKVLYPLKITSVYTYIFLRFQSSALTTFTICTTMVGTFFFMGICIYSPSLAMETITGMPNWASVIIMGVICTIYSSLGGVRAVVYTDVFQTIITFIGVIIVIVVSNVDVGGTAEVWKLNDEYGRVEFFNLSFNPLERHTLWFVIIQGYFGSMLVFGMGQPQVQRICSVSTWNKAILAHYINLGLLLFLYCSVYYMGVSIFAVYAGCDPMATGAIDKPDQITPFYVDDKLSKWPGVSGMFVASLYAGSLSSYSSQINAVSAVIWEGYLKESQWVRTMREDRKHLPNILVSVITGLFGILAGIIAGSLGGLFQVGQMILGTIHAPLLGLFILGMTCPFANKIGGTIGFTISLIFNVWLTIGSSLFSTGHPHLDWTDDKCPATTDFTTNTFTDVYESFGTTKHHDDDVFPLYQMSYTLYSLCGVSITFFVGTVCSLISGPWSTDKSGEKYLHPTFYKLMRKWEKRKSSKTSTIDLVTLGNE